MVGPLDPNSPDQDHGSAPASPDSDLHALLERLLGQGDIRPPSGAADELWPELQPTTTAVADEVSTIVPAPESPAVVVEPTPMITFADASDLDVAEPPAARRWEPVVVDTPAASTNVDDIHAAILAKVTVALEPIAPPAAEAAAEPIVDAVAEPIVETVPEPVTETVIPVAFAAPVVTPEPEPTAFEPGTFDASLFEPAAAEPSFQEALDAAAFALAGFEPSMFEVPQAAPLLPERTAVEPVFELPALAAPVVEAAAVEPEAVEAVAPAAFEPVAFEPVAFEPAAFESLALEAATIEPGPDAAAVAPIEIAIDEPTPFSLTPFEAPAPTPASTGLDFDADALWAAAVPELGLDLAPQLDLDDDADAGPVGPTAVVLPWPTADVAPREAVAFDAAPESPEVADVLEVAEVVEVAEAAADTVDVAEVAAIEVADVAPVVEVADLAELLAPQAPIDSDPQDLIEAALAGLQGDLTAEPVEPLRTPEVAASSAHVIFRLGSRTMAIPLAAVSEIARPPKTTRLPHVPAWVLGIANLRGDIVSMLDLEGFFSGKVGRSTHEQRMLALRPAGDEVRTAVLVDSVDGIQALEDARVARVTRGYDAEVAPYARGLYQLEGNLVVVLDADRLLQSKPMRQFEDGAGAR